ncbi:MAG TPA: putative metal-binding motif-containing protein [Candidatus Saccharimonadia bacterium]|nr:putative metal-binding motif-containing protein [Candidatus Saccharimonadia bacterium]
MRTTAAALLGVIALAGAEPARASFHFMQIEQAIAGVQGDATQQAVQLRMRFAGQNQMQASRLRVSDANGANPVLLFDFTAPVTNGSAGDRVLVASASFAAAQGITPDAIMTNTIPLSYLGGGRLTFESDDGGVVYSLCWGSYGGPNTGTTDNDPDGQFGPCEPGPLPSSSLVALRFTGIASAISTTNAADYAPTSAAAVFSNNARAQVTISGPQPVSAVRGGDCDDTDANVFAGQVEAVGNRFDDDCDGLADEDANNAPSSDSGDADFDGFSLAAGDCDDTNPAARPSAAEIAGDRYDNDCDGLADEDANDNPALDAVDHDGDGRAVFDRVFVSGFEDPAS